MFLQVAHLAIIHVCYGTLGDYFGKDSRKIRGILLKNQEKTEKVMEKLGNIGGKSKFF